MGLDSGFKLSWHLVVIDSVLFYEVLERSLLSSCNFGFFLRF